MAPATSDASTRIVFQRRALSEPHRLCFFSFQRVPPPQTRQRVNKSRHATNQPDPWPANYPFRAKDRVRRARGPARPFPWLRSLHSRQRCRQLHVACAGQHRDGDEATRAMSIHGSPSYQAYQNCHVFVSVTPHTCPHGPEATRPQSFVHGELRLDTRLPWRAGRPPSNPNRPLSASTALKTPSLPVCGSSNV
jgi:hypothetical protein